MVGAQVEGSEGGEAAELRGQRAPNPKGNKREGCEAGEPGERGEERVSGESRGQGTRAVAIDAELSDSGAETRDGERGRGGEVAEIGGVVQRSERGRVLEDALEAEEGPDLRRGEVLCGDLQGLDGDEGKKEEEEKGWRL